MTNERRADLCTKLAVAIAQHSVGGRWPRTSTVDAARPLADVLMDLFELRDDGPADTAGRRGTPVHEGTGQRRAVCG